jgi:hypothetical protein
MRWIGLDCTECETNSVTAHAVVAIKVKTQSLTASYRLGGSVCADVSELPEGKRWEFLLSKSPANVSIRFVYLLHPFLTRSARIRIALPNPIRVELPRQYSIPLLHLDQRSVYF